MKVLRYYIVDIGGSNEMMYREAHSMCNQSGCEVAEVATRYAKNNRRSPIADLFVCLKIVKALWYQSGNVDGIGRTEPYGRTEFGV